MGDLVEEGLEFRGGTLQLSSETSNDHGLDHINDKNIPKESAGQSSSALVVQERINSSVLSGADSLSTSTSSINDARFENATDENNERVQTVCPRYDMPFNRDSIKDFFTFRNGIAENAIQECITGLIFPEDGELIGSYLLTEITLWDNEKERIVLLTDKLVMTVKYDFIAMKQLDFKKTFLADLDTIVIGELVYPASSIVPRLNGLATGVTAVVRDCVVERWNKNRPTTDTGEFKLFDTKYFEPRERNLRGVRLMWNRGQPLPFYSAWNPFNQDIPFLTFASHPVYWHKVSDPEDTGERAIYDMESFAQNLSQAVQLVLSADCCINNSPIVIQSYLGVTSLLHNKNSLGFFKVRGKFSF